VSGSVLQHFLKTRLPDYMIPSTVMFLEVLPLTPNGKVDVRALPAVSGDGLETTRPFAAPRTPIEAMLAEIWSEILSLTRISVHSNFFELGGHSLLVTQVVSRVRDACQVVLPLRALFESPTVVELAAQIQRAMQSGDARPAELPILRIPRDGRLALSFAQQRLWFIDQLEGGTGLYNISNTLRLEGTLVLPALEQSFAAVAQRHESLRTTFAVVDGRPSQVIDPVFAGSLLRVDLSTWPETERDSEARRIACADAVQPFDLTQGPLLRLTLIRLAPRQHALVLTLHHIIADGWSMGLLVQELAQHYAARVRGEAAALPELPVQYADFAHWQQQWLHTSGALEAQLAYWRQRLADAPAVLELPFDRPRPAVQSFLGATQAFRLPAALVESLTGRGRQSQATLFI
jgi:hypothetical protein